jgi:outer membrane protein assembly factor BamB
MTMPLQLNCSQHGVATKRVILVLCVLAVVATILAVVYIPDRTSEPSSSNGDGVVETVPVEISVSGPAPDEANRAFEEKARTAIRNEIFRVLQEKSPRGFSLVFAGNGEEAHRINPNKLLRVWYEESRIYYHLDEKGYYHLSKPGEEHVYMGRSITVYVTGIDRSDADRELTTGIWAATSESVKPLPGKDPQQLLRDDALANLCTKFDLIHLEQLPPFCSFILAGLQCEWGPFSSQTLISVSPSHIYIGEGPHGGPGFPATDIRTNVRFADAVGNRAVLFYDYFLPSAVIHYYSVDILTGATWQFTAPSCSTYVYPNRPPPETARIVDDTVYIFFADKIFALDLASGSEKWEQEFSGETSTTGGGKYHYLTPDAIVIDEDSIYFRGDGSGIIALDQLTGERKWVSEQGAAWGPRLVGEQIYGAGYESTFQHELFAVDAKTGKTLWAVSIGSELDLGNGGPVIAQGLVYARTVEGSIYAYDANTGKQKWQVKGSEIITPPDSRVVYVNDGYYLTALDSSTGTAVWRYIREDSGTFTQAILADTTIGVEDKGVFHALDLDTGTEKWVFPVGKDVASTGSGARAYQYRSGNGFVFVHDWLGFLHALDGQTGEEKWNFGAIDYEAVDNEIYANSDAGVWVVDANSGMIEWYYPYSTSEIAKVEAGTIYILDSRAKTYAQNGTDYDEIWQPGDFLRAIKLGGAPAEVVLPEFTAEEARARELVEIEVKGVTPLGYHFADVNLCECVKITFTRSPDVPNPIRVTIPEGTMLISNDSRFENKVFRRVLKEEATVVRPYPSGRVDEHGLVPTSDFVVDYSYGGIWKEDFILEAYSVELGKESPTEATTFSLGSMCDPSVLGILEAADSLTPEEASCSIIQSAILSATSDASYEEIGLPMSMQKIELVRNLLQLAGIDPQGKKLFTGINDN